MKKDDFLAETIVTDTEVEKFARHLLIDGYGGAGLMLADAARVKAALVESAELLQLEMLVEPLIVKDASAKDPTALCASVLLETSHINIHTLPAQGFVSADIYVRRGQLEADKFLSILQNQFDLQTLDSQVINRGVYYPDKPV